MRRNVDLLDVVELLIASDLDLIAVGIHAVERDLVLTREELACRHVLARQSDEQSPHRVGIGELDSEMKRRRRRDRRAANQRQVELVDIRCRQPSASALPSQLKPKNVSQNRRLRCWSATARDR
jgi:hypothetical protein